MSAELAPRGATDLGALQSPVTMGFGDLASFEFLQRSAKAFSSSTMVPAAYQAMVTKGYGERATLEPNQAAVPNCMIALDMAQRLQANPLMVMQNLHIIEGRPSWSSQFIIAAINSCGRFSPLRFNLEWLDQIDATYSTYEWEDRKKVERKHKVQLRNARCVAWTVERGTSIPQFSQADLKEHGGIYGCCRHYGVPILESAPVTMEMAVNEGWYGKNGSKWRSMPDLMLRYRSAAFFGRIYAPELLMGLPTTEEVQDVFVQDTSGNTVFSGQQAVPRSTGTIDPNTGEVKPMPLVYPEDEFELSFPKWVALIQGGKKTADQVITMASSKHQLSEVQKKRIREVEMPKESLIDGPTPAVIEQRLRDAQDIDSLNAAADLINGITDTAENERLSALYDDLMGRMTQE